MTRRGRYERPRARRDQNGRDALPKSAALSRDIDSDRFEVLKRLFLRALNDNQIFLLEHVDGEGSSLHSFLEELTEEYDKSLSTLKYNARILKELDLIKYGEKNDPEPVTLSKNGEMVVQILNGSNAKKESDRHDER